MLDILSLRVSSGRLGDRCTLPTALDRLDRTIDQTGTMHSLDEFQQQAVHVPRGTAREAFDLSKEDPRIRALCGEGLGQELLLARRLCEAGAGFVTLNNGDWDHHGRLIPRTPATLSTARPRGRHLTPPVPPQDGVTPYRVWWD